jgi:hypothetical protein
MRWRLSFTPRQSSASGRGVLLLDDGLPALGQFGVQRDERPLVGRHVVLGVDRLDGALRHAERAVDALVGSITRKLGPSRKQSTGQTSTQSVNLHLMQLSVTT